MESQPNRNISVIEPLSEAFARTKLILFSPFDMEKWFIIGFCAWLAQLGSRGGGNFNPGGGNWGGGGGGGPSDDVLPPDLKNQIFQHLPVIITVGVLVFVITLAIGLLVTWLNSRGRFMFLDCVANNTAEVKRPWTEHRHLGNSLFMFRIAVGLIGLFILLLMIGAGVFVYFRFGHGDPDSAKVPIIISIIVIVVLFVPIAIIFGLIKKFTDDFVVPIMYLRNCRCTEAWRKFLDLAGHNKGVLALYVLFGIVLGMASGVVVLVLFLTTCCIACCINAIPYLGTVMLLPILTFMRCYSLYFLRQFGNRFDVFPAAEEPKQFVPVGVDPFE